MPSASFVHAAAATRPPPVVWDRLQDAATWAEIGPVEQVWDPVHDSGALASFRWRTTVGPTRYQGVATVVTSEPEEAIELSLDAGEVTGSLRTELSPADGDGTLLRVTLTVVSRGMLSTMFFPVISEAVGRSLPEQVESFAARL